MNAAIKTGNNESISIGVFQNGNEFIALTPTRSKTFKTSKSAEKWLDRNWTAWREAVALHG